MWQERAEAAAEEAAATRSELLALGSELGNLQRLHSQEVSALTRRSLSLTWLPIDGWPTI